MSEQQYLRITAAPSTLVVFLCMTLPLFFLYLWLDFFRHLTIAPTVITGALCILAYLWWQCFLLEIDTKSVSYRTLLGGTRRIALNDIGKVIHKVDLKSPGIRPPIRLEIYTREDQRKVAFDINLKVFSLQDIARINAALKPFIAHKS